MKITVATWNMDHWKRSPAQREAAWARLRNLGADAVLLQETVPPRDVPRDRIVWREIGRERRFGSAVVSLSGPVEEIVTAKSCYSYLAFPLLNTFPGSVAIGRFHPKEQKPITLVSVYGVIDVYSTTTLLRQVADLVPLFDSRDGTRVVLGGDLNITLGIGADERARYAAVFQAIESLGLVNLFERVKNRPPAIEGCDCNLKPCFHVGTHRNANYPDGIPRHLDYLFASPELANRCSRIRLEDDASIWELSDHCPVLAEFDLMDETEPQAWDDRYVSDVAATLRAVLAERREWTSWTPGTRDPVVRTDRKVSSWIVLVAKGTLRDGSAGELEFGIWREPSRTGHPLVVHAGIWRGPEWARLAPTHTADASTSMVEKDGRAYLTVPMTDGSLPEREAREALDKLLRSLETPT